MHLITRKRIVEFSGKYPRARVFLMAWSKAARTGLWASIDDVRSSYPHADAVVVGSGRIATVFNVCGNDYRLITAIHYNRQRIFVIALLTHAEYSKNLWKRRL